MLIEQKETVGFAQGRRSDLVPSGDQVAKPTLAEVGIDKKLSSRLEIERLYDDERSFVAAIW